MALEPLAWLVVGAHGERSVHLDHTHALNLAAQQHGVLNPLVSLEDHEAYLINFQGENDGPIDSRSDSVGGSRIGLLGP